MNKPEMPLLTEFPCSKCPDWVTAIECGCDEGNCDRYWKWLHQKEQRESDMDWHYKEVEEIKREIEKDYKLNSPTIHDEMIGFSSLSLLDNNSWQQFWSKYLGVNDG